MPGPPWDDDDPADRATILENIDKLVRSMRASAGVRTVPGVAVVQRWHADIYDSCHLPVAGYAGHFRGEPTVAELVGYEVGVGPRQADGYPDRVGLPAAAVPTAVLRLLADLGRAVATLDAHVPTGQRPADPAALQSIAALAATVHGEWVRIHPFANGNGRTARLWAAWIALRYNLPIFVTVKPRPADVDYATAARLSMGPPPDYRAEHGVAAAVFARMLANAIASNP